jgi:hypothetical protein
LNLSGSGQVACQKKKLAIAIYNFIDLRHLEANLEQHKVSLPDLVVA